MVSYWMVKNKKCYLEKAILDSLKELSKIIFLVRFESNSIHFNKI